MTVWPDAAGSGIAPLYPLGHPLCQGVCQLLLGIRVNNPFKFIGIDHKAQLQQHRRRNMGTGKGQIIPVNAVAGPIQLGDQIVVEELGQVVSLGMVPRKPQYQRYSGHRHYRAGRCSEYSGPGWAHPG